MSNYKYMIFIILSFFGGFIINRIKDKITIYFVRSTIKSIKWHPDFHHKYDTWFDYLDWIIL